MSKIAVIHFQETFTPYDETVTLLSRPLTLHHVACSGDVGAVCAYIQQFDGQVEAIALQGLTRHLNLGAETVEHEEATKIFALATQTPVVDGQGILPTMERWALRLANEQEPGIWSQKRVLLVPGLNHEGLAQTFPLHSAELMYADPMIYFALPTAPGVGSPETVDPAAKRTLPQLREFSFSQLFPPAGTPHQPRSPKLFEWADVLAGDMGAIRRYAPEQLPRKTVVVTHANDEDLADLKQRGVSIVVTTLPTLAVESHRGLAKHGPAVFEAALCTLREDKTIELSENTYLNLMAHLNWRPGVIYLQPEEAEVNHFAYVMIPSTPEQLNQFLGWSKFMPRFVLERTNTHLLPHHVSNMTGLQSTQTGQKAEGVLFMLAGTPEEFAEEEPSVAQRRLVRAAHMAERLGARVLGLSWHTAAIEEVQTAVAAKSSIALTTGHSLTVVGLLEAGVMVSEKMGQSRPEAAVLGATAGLGKVSAQWLSGRVNKLILVDDSPDKLIALKQELEKSSRANIIVSTSVEDALPQAHLIVTTIPSTEKKVAFDITVCRPGAVIVDLGLPVSVPMALDEQRPDVLVLQACDWQLPGQPDLGYDFQLPTGVVPSHLAEVITLALEGKTTDYTLGRETMTLTQLHEIWQLSHKHGLQPATIRAHEAILSDILIAEKRRLADEFRADPQKLTSFLQKQEEAAAPPPAEVVQIGTRQVKKRSLILGGFGLFSTILLAIAGFFFYRKRQQPFIEQPPTEN